MLRGATEKESGDEKVNLRVDRWKGISEVPPPKVEGRRREEWFRKTFRQGSHKFQQIWKGEARDFRKEQLL